MCIISTFHTQNDSITRCFHIKIYTRFVSCFLSYISLTLSLFCLYTLNPVYFSSPRARRAAKEAKEAPAQPAPEKVKVEVKKFVKIGRPGYKGTSPKCCNCNWFRIKYLLSLHKRILFILFLFSPLIDSNETEGSRDWSTESPVSGNIIGASDR